MQALIIPGTSFSGRGGHCPRSGGREKLPSRRMAAAFTLIELLVVVAIIAILASLLAPLLRKSLDTARTAQCLNNQRQCATAFQMYTGDYHGVLPRPSSNAADNWRYWQDYILVYLGFPASKTGKDYQQKVYIGKIPVFIGKGPLSCPAVTPQEILDADIANGNTGGGRHTQNGKIGIGANSFMAGYNSTTKQNFQRHLSSLRRPGLTFLTMDMHSDNGTGQPAASDHLKTWGGSGGGAYGSPAWPMFCEVEKGRHNGGYCVVVSYFDGHAAQREFLALPNKFTNTSEGNIGNWWYK